MREKGVLSQCPFEILTFHYLPLVRSAGTIVAWQTMPILCTIVVSSWNLGSWLHSTYSRGSNSEVFHSFSDQNNWWGPCFLGVFTMYHGGHSFYFLFFIFSCLWSCVIWRSTYRSAIRIIELNSGLYCLNSNKVSAPHVFKFGEHVNKISRQWNNLQVKIDLHARRFSKFHLVPLRCYGDQLGGIYLLISWFSKSHLILSWRCVN